MNGTKVKVSNIFITVRILVPFTEREAENYSNDVGLKSTLRCLTQIKSQKSGATPSPRPLVLGKQCIGE
jgi:hypothetical protein